MNKNERLQLALPTGPFQEDILDCLKNQVGLNFKRAERCYFVTVNNLPIDFVLMRARNIPWAIKDSNTLVGAGITGSNVLWESGLGLCAGEEFPLYQFSPKTPQAQLYVGFTQAFKRQIYELKGCLPNYQDLSGSMIATKYPNIAAEVFSAKGVSHLTYQPVPGTEEGLQYIFPNCNGILDILTTGKTLKANQIEILEIIHKVVLRIIQEESKMNTHDLEILADLQEKIAVSLQRKVA